MTLNKKALSRWALALWSGEYEQGAGGLAAVEMVIHENGKVEFIEDSIKFCCLGVACEIFQEAAGLTRRYYRGSYYYGVNEEEQNGGFLPRSVVEYLGFTPNELSLGNVILTDPETGDTYAANIWNDRYKKTFKEIAVMINHTYDLGLNLTDNK